MVLSEKPKQFGHSKKKNKPTTEEENQTVKKKNTSREAKRALMSNPIVKLYTKERT